jgi:hypothetical protein
MYKTNVCLFISSFDLEKNERFILSTTEEKYIPLSIELQDYHKTVRDALRELFESTVVIDFEWINPLLVDVLKEDDSINIHYACTIPPETEIKQGSRISVHLAIINKIARKSLSYV